MRSILFRVFSTVEISGAGEAFLAARHIFDPPPQDHPLRPYFTGHSTFQIIWGRVVSKNAPPTTYVYIRKKSEIQNIRASEKISNDSGVSRKPPTTQARWLYDPPFALIVTSEQFRRPAAFTYPSPKCRRPKNKIHDIAHKSPRNLPFS